MSAAARIVVVAGTTAIATLIFSGAALAVLVVATAEAAMLVVSCEPEPGG